MCPLIEELRTKKANLRRAALRKVQSTTLADLPEVEGYRAAVADLSATLMGSNVEAARTAVFRKNCSRATRRLYPAANVYS